MLLKILVKTPKNQAPVCIKTQKAALVGHKTKVKEQKVVKHNLFYWILEVADDKEMSVVTYKCARGEVVIKKFYGMLFKILRRANKLAGKFKKGVYWIRRYMKKQINKHGKSDPGMMNYIDSMSDEQILDFIKITDKEEMEKLLSGPLIKVEQLPVDNYNSDTG